MNKDIENYLHLYLGCEIYYPDTKEFDNINWVHLLDVWTCSKRGEKYKPGYKLVLLPMPQAPNECSAEMFYSLLSKYFDIFGLIEAGLAIESTSLKEIQP